MDSTIQYLYSLLPDQWKPYVVLVLLVLYVVTKLRSHQKSAELMKKNAFLSATATQKEFLPEIADQGFFSKIIDVIF